MNVEKRLEIERKVIRHLIRTMKKHGWIISYINDGGEEDENIVSPNESEALDAVFSVDESTIAFRKQVGKKGVTCFVQIILGNDGWDCISDYTFTDEFEKIMREEVDPYAEKLEEEK